MNIREILSQPKNWLAKLKDKPTVDRRQGELFHAEITAVKSVLYGSYFDNLKNPDKILTEKMSGLSYAGYDKMLEQDCHLSSVVQTRKLAVAGLDWDIFPYIAPGAKTASAEDQMIADNIKWIINDIDNFHKIKMDMLLAYDHGFSIGEIMYDKYWPNGAGSGLPSDFIKHPSWVVIEEIKSRYPANFAFNNDNELTFSKDGYGKYEKLPPEKMLVYSFNAKYENRYGTALCKTAYWPHWFKSTLIRYMMIFSERLGQPPIFGKAPANWTAAQRQILLDNLKDMQNDSIFVVPDDVIIELLEAKFRSEGKFRESIEFFNDEQSKLVLGQTLSSGEGRRSGSLALGEVHNNVREDITIADAADLSAAIRMGIVRPLVQYNFGFDKTVPQFKLLASGSKDLNKDALTVKVLVEAGLPLIKQELYDRFGFGAPQEGDEVLERPAAQSNPGFNNGQFQFAAKTPHAHHLAVSDSINGLDIAIVGKIQDRLYSFLRDIYDSIERELLMGVQPGMPLHGLIDQAVRRYFGPEISARFGEQVGQAAYIAAFDLAKRLKIALSKEVFNSIKDRYLADNFYAKGKIEGMADTLRKILNNQLPAWDKVGFDVDQMKQLIKNNFADLKEWKVNLIARNEVSQAAHEGMFRMIEQSGMQKEFEANFIVDPISCDICQEWASHNPYTVEQARSMGLPHIQCNDQWSFSLKGDRNG